MIDLKKFLKSFSHALHGFVFAFKKEQNIKIEVLAALFVFAAMVIAQVKVWEAVVLTVMIFGVIVLEVLNTALEQLINMLKPRIHPKAKVLKDLMASAVFLASLGAAIVGLLIFLPYIR